MSERTLPHNRASRRERGMALIIVMVMLLLLSILGVTLLTSTTTDLQITGDYRNDGRAFYAADAALQFGQVNALIYSTIHTNAGASWPPQGDGLLLKDDGTLPEPSIPANHNTQYPDYHQMIIYKDPVTKNHPQGTANVKVEFVGTGPVPVGAGTEVDAGLGGGSGFRANYYLVSVIADGPHDSSHAELESEVARVVPK